MNCKVTLFYKEEIIEYVYDPETHLLTCPIDTFRHISGNPYPWTRLILVRKKPVWAKVALSNVPKRYRLMLVLFE